MMDILAEIAAGLLLTILLLAVITDREETK